MKNKHFAAFELQKRGAATRGIGWELTFEEWLAFWGNDIDRRGRGPNDLQMQRPCDTGPYAAWNIRKGTPKQNSATYSVMEKNRKSAKAAKDHQARLDAMMWMPSAPNEDEDIFLTEEDTASEFGNNVQTNFMRTSRASLQTGA